MAAVSLTHHDIFRFSYGLRLLNALATIRPLIIPPKESAYAILVIFWCYSSVIFRFVRKSVMSIGCASPWLSIYPCIEYTVS